MKSPTNFANPAERANLIFLFAQEFGDGLSFVKQEARKHLTADRMAVHLKHLAIYFGEESSYDSDLTSALVGKFVNKEDENQFTWIKGELVRQTILRQKRAEMTSARRFLENHLPALNNHQLEALIMNLCAHFGILENFGTEHIDVNALTRLEIVLVQFDQIINRCVDPNNLDAIHSATYFYVSRSEFDKLYPNRLSS
ncbi:hypothetical protein GPALN_004176 [Globodera pallida]|nr:hypothetical protein GPALN_004176 [Globodera pallida]